MGFPINYLLQLLQSVTYHFLPVHGLEGKCTFPIVLFKVCQKQQQQLKPADNTTINNSSMDKNGNSHPTMESPSTLLQNLNLDGVSDKTLPAIMLSPIDSRPLMYPAVLYETRKNPAAMKHSLVEVNGDEAEDDVQRSMARRKKNEPPMDINKKCSHCDKVFKRPCDFTKHEKTHSRPWKCPIEDCKYHHVGWPTEKERDRHVNDRHSDNPPAYNCMFNPCTYTSKRESNLKQHMEKAHGWKYVRSKKNGKRGQTPSASEGSPNQTTPPTPSLPLTPAMSTPVSSLSTELPSPSSGHMPSPYSQTMSATEPVIYNGSYVDGYTNMANGQAFNFADPPMMSGYDYSDFQLFPSADLDNISLDPVPHSQTEDFTTFNQTLDAGNTHELISQPPSADMTLDQLGQDHLNPYCFDSEFYNYQSNGLADFQQNNGMSDFQPTNGMPEFHHNGMPEF